MDLGSQPISGSTPSKNYELQQAQLSKEIKVHQWLPLAATNLKNYDLILRAGTQMTKILEYRNLTGELKIMRGLVKVLLSAQKGLSLSDLNPLKIIHGMKDLQTVLLSWSSVTTILGNPLKAIQDSELIKYGLEAINIGQVHLMSESFYVATAVDWLTLPSPYLKTSLKIISFNTALKELHALSEKADPDLVYTKQIELLKTSIEVAREAGKIALGFAGTTATTYYLGIALSALAIVSAGVGLWQIHKKTLEDLHEQIEKATIDLKGISIESPPGDVIIDIPNQTENQ